MNPRLPSLLMLAAAHDDMGMYPAATVDAQGVRTERTPWQDGWNAACLELTQRWCALMDWLRALEPAEQSLLLGLLEEHALDVSFTDGQVSLLLNMNDTFALACADCEEVPLQDLEKLEGLWRQFGGSGLTAYAAYRRKEVPIAARRDALFESALASLK